MRGTLLPFLRVQGGLVGFVWLLNFMRFFIFNYLVALKCKETSLHISCISWFFGAGAKNCPREQTLITSIFEFPCSDIQFCFSFPWAIGYGAQSLKYQRD